MLVGYVGRTMDAAIADDVLDLVFKNNQKTPVYIESVLSGGNLTFNIYGKETRDPGRTLEFVSETTESKETEGKRFVATEDYIGYMGLQSAAHPEISAQLWKVVYEKQCGSEPGRDQLQYLCCGAGDIRCWNRIGRSGGDGEDESGDPDAG